MSLVKYTDIVIEENNDPLVDLSLFDFILDPKYFKGGLSNTDKMFIRQEIALKLQRIQKKLKIYKFKIWDGYRSREVQENIYKKYYRELEQKNPDWNKEKLILETGKFVSPPYDKGRIPLHATGGSIDLTLVDEEGKELNMGTEFDFFGPEASPLYYEKDTPNKNISSNRKILRESMLSENFTMDKDEWWHFDYGNQIWALYKNKNSAFYGEAKL